MKSKLLLASLFSVAALTACGGGGDDTTTPDATAAATGTPAPAPFSGAPAPAPAAAATFDAQCPDGARKVTLTNSTISGANSSVVNDNVTLRYKFPTSSTTVMVCPLSASTAGFPVVPAALTAIMTGAPAAVVIATGDFAALSNKQLEIVVDFGAQSAEAIAAKKLISYTITAGAWTRTPLATTLAAGATASSRVVSAPVDQPGFYTVE